MVSKNNNHARVLTVDQMTKVYETIPQSWMAVAGILRKKNIKINPLAFQKKIRSEWSRRLK